MKPSFDPSVSTSLEVGQHASPPSGDVPAGNTPPRHAVESLPPALSALRNPSGPSNPALRPSSFRVPGSNAAPVVLAPIPRRPHVLEPSSAAPNASLDLKRPANPAHNSSPFRAPREPAPTSEKASAWGRMANRAAQLPENRKSRDEIRRHLESEMDKPRIPEYLAKPHAGAESREDIRKRKESEMDAPRNPVYLAEQHADTESREDIRKRKESEMDTPRTPKYPSAFRASEPPVSAPPASEPPATLPRQRMRTNPETGEKLAWTPINPEDDDVDEHVKAHALRLRERITGRADTRELNVNDPLDAKCLEAALQRTDVVDLSGVAGYDRTARRTPDAH
ncbi:hypothetical protein BSTAB16_6740 [Burkholderia stabilis]|uniref:Uncharacterized protein n=2 Tax=Burkholderia stabilis TaxID=95485 RepID=A0AAJ5T8L9_9BURK|nr:hypothetical protein BSTAB16_6740 [Burkholderia stabilis]